MNPIEKNHVRTKTFGAVEFLRKCDRFIEAYSRLLSAAVVDQVTCSIHEWKNNTASFDIICESLDVSKVYGVSSFHALEGTQNLPVEEAKVEVVATVPQQIRKTSKKGAVELCGLCNSIGLAGLGIGAVYLMKRAFCSACTSRIANNYGFIKYTDISNEGKIYYPRLDLIARVCFVQDIELLAEGDLDETIVISKLKYTLNLLQVEETRGRKLVVDSQLEINNIDLSVFEWNQVKKY